jgi:hypothetical protein
MLILMTFASNGFSQDTLKIAPHWKLSSCSLDYESNKSLDTLLPNYDPETEYLELVLIEYYTLNASAIWTKCRLESLSELLSNKGLEIDAMTPKTYYGDSDDLRRLGKRGELRMTYLIVHRRTSRTMTFGKP